MSFVLYFQVVESYIFGPLKHLTPCYCVLSKILWLNHLLKYTQKTGMVFLQSLLRCRFAGKALMALQHFAKLPGALVVSKKEREKNNKNIWQMMVAFLHLAFFTGLKKYPLPGTHMYSTHVQYCSEHTKNFAFLLLLWDNFCFSLLDLSLQGELKVYCKAQ